DISSRARSEQALSIAQSELTLIQWALNKKYAGISSEPEPRTTLSTSERKFLKRYAAENGLPLSQYLNAEVGKRLILEGQGLLRERDETQYRAARGDLDRLRGYLRTCKACTFEASARSEI